MRVRHGFLAAATCATLAVAAPTQARPARSAWSWDDALAACAVTAGTTARLAVRLPTHLDDVAAELQVRRRDAARQVDDVIARVFPTRPSTLDLAPLIASPVPGVESSGFGWRRDPIHRREKFHRGTDYRADRGTPVYAAGAGIVGFTGRQGGYGNVIYIDHGGGLVTRYAHLKKIEVKAGTALGAATRIGQVGTTGRTTGPHLHFEVRLDGRAVDPVLALRVAALEQVDPAAAQEAARALAPEVQDTSVDRHDPPRAAKSRKRVAGQRPERTGAPARSRALW